MIQRPDLQGLRKDRLIAVVLACCLAACSSRESLDDQQEVIYVPDAGYHQLMAEIALQRGDYMTAAREYLNTAQQSESPETARRATEFAYDYAYDAYALHAAERWVALQPDSRLGHTYLAQLQFRRNELDGSFDSFEVALGPVEERVDRDYLTLATDLGREQEFARAVAIFERLAKRYDTSPGVWASLSLLAQQGGYEERALQSAERAFELAPDWIRAKNILAYALADADQTDAGLQLMTEIRAAEPGLASEMEYVRMLAAVGGHEVALQYIEELQEIYPERPELIRMRGIVHLADNNIEAAVEDFTQMLMARFNVNEGIYYLAQIQLSNEEYAEAVEMLGAIVSGPYLVPAQIAISRAYEQLGDAETGIEELRHFAERHPRYAFDVLVPEANLLLGMERDPEALETIEYALIFKPDSVDLMLTKGGILDRMKQVDDAVEVFERALEIAPEDPTVLNALGYTLANNKRRYRDAHGYIKQALALDPDNPAIQDSMGWVLYRRGKLEQAREYLEQAYATMADPEIAAHWGEVLWKQGEEEAAQQLWAESLEKYPSSEPLQETMQRLMN
ncbi:MAG: tetratricopeptide repeat protein [Gammaproteobacteria bacterium]